MKKNHYKEKLLNTYFWRVYTGSEIDYVEEGAGRYKAFEFKFSKSKARKPETFFENYQPAEFKVINKDNYLSFVI